MTTVLARRGLRYWKHLAVHASDPRCDRGRLRAERRYSPVALAIEAIAEPGTAIVPRVAGLPDELFAHDGQLTKREIRAVTLSTLAPRGDELLWDIGAGAGSIGIEWLLAHPPIAPSASRRARTASTRRDPTRNRSGCRISICGSAPRPSAKRSVDARRWCSSAAAPAAKACSMQYGRLADGRPTGSQFRNAGNRGDPDRADRRATAAPCSG